MDGQGSDAKGVSYALFNNAAFADIVLTAQEIFERDEQPAFVTTRQVASKTGRSDSVVKPVMVRLVAAGLLEPLPKSGPSNSVQFYARQHPSRWQSLVALLHTLGHEVERKERLDGPRG